MFWLDYARKYIGVSEIPGPRHSSVIQGWLKSLHAWWVDDETPWCGVFVAAVMQESGLAYPKQYYRALEWLKAGRVIDRPAVGCIVVFTRQGGGHVGFVVGEDEWGRLMVLGGNQRNQVNILPFSKQRVSGYVWPDKNSMPKSYKLPLVNSHGQKVSENES